ncbi:unnamed protein product [Lasius platythorax]|uniref:Uncharacterized protein n=1 Tax=Lasius platythorax TaxID=488582 RepID=A0AAV2PAG8_9HYME
MYSDFFRKTSKKEILF